MEIKTDKELTAAKLFKIMCTAYRTACELIASTVKDATTDEIEQCIIDEVLKHYEQEEKN